MPQNGNNSPTAYSQSTQSSKQEAEAPNIATKLCHIVKRPDFEGYGFNLHSEKSKPGQFIGKVDGNSPAELAGLKEGDRIIEVNGVPIGSETHKQVVQRIKAMSCEVRLLLIDVDKLNSVDYSVESKSTVQKIPGSANISSISMTSTKRISDANSISRDIIPNDNVISNQAENGTNLESEVSTNHNNIHNMNAATPPPSSSSSSSADARKNNNSHNNNNNNNTGSLQLPTTAAEMRAKLLSKKKYDPKNESVDLKKKFDIIQKL